MVRFFDKSFGTQMLKPMFRSYVINSFNRVKPEEQAYFRPPRDRVIGQSLEAVTADADSYFASMREALLLMRLALRQHTYLAETSRTTPSTSPGAPCNRIGAQAAAVPAPIGGE